MLRNLFLPFRRGDILSFRAKAGMDSRGMARMTDYGDPHSRTACCADHDALLRQLGGVVGARL